jgi:hypothetical protein
MIVVKNAPDFTPDKIMGGPDAGQPEYSPLPVRVGLTPEGNPVYTSAWAMTPEEFEQFLETKTIYLHILGSQPPVMLSLDPELSYEGD